MPISLTIHSAQGLLHVRLSGRIRLEDMLIAHRDFAAMPEFRPGVDKLVEFLPGADLDMTFAQMRQLRRSEENYYDTAPRVPRCAILAPEEAQYGMGRMYASLADLRGDVVCDVFNLRDDACGFLGIPAKTLACLQPVT